MASGFAYDFIHHRRNVPNASTTTNASKPNPFAIVSYVLFGTTLVGRGLVGCVSRSFGGRCQGTRGKNFVCDSINTTFTQRNVYLFARGISH